MREAFEKALGADPYDTVTRSVYADWLEEQGRDDEAAEQRRRAGKEWRDAREWLTDFAKEGGEDGYGEKAMPITLDDLIEAGHNGFTQVGSSDLQGMMRGDTRGEFWKHWSAYTGASADGREDTNPFSCTC